MKTNDSYKKITQQSYNGAAEEYAQNVADLASMVSIEKFIGYLPKDAKILDIGCGSGRDAQIMTNKGVQVTGIDFCPNLLEIAQKTAPLAQFQLMDIEAMDFLPNSFDGMWAACSLVHISKLDILNVFKKMYSFLKNNGYVYITLKKGTGEALIDDDRYATECKKFCAYYEESELKELLQSAGFEVLSLELISRNQAYQSHDSLRVFCRKNESSE